MPTPRDQYVNPDPYRESYPRQQTSIPGASRNTSAFPYPEPTFEQLMDPGYKVKHMPDAGKRDYDRWLYGMEQRIMWGRDSNGGLPDCPPDMPARGRSSFSR